MFESLSNRLNDVFDKLKKRGALSEADVTAALREIRVALLEADVALPVVKDFIEAVRERAVGEEVTRSVTPGQMVIKIVNDHLTEMLGGDSVEINLAATPPVAIMMVGLQGSGKTTTTAKLALHLRDRYRKKTLMASLDVRRPAAQQQLKVLGEETTIATLPVVPLETPELIARRAMDTARKEGFDVVLLDTAGRLHIDDELMKEAASIHELSKPVETLFVADAMTGQDAVIAAKAFHDSVHVTGIVLTRIDGDARGGAALSVKAVTGCPIKLLGTGEKMDALEVFHPERIASRILGMGDVVTLVEKAQENIDEEDAEKLAARIQKGQFDFEDFASQLRQVRKMGGMGGIMGMLPGVGKIKNQMAGANIDDKALARQEAIILSMTPKERRNPKVFNGSRRKRIAAGSGTSVQEVNRLLKQFTEMSKMMKRMNKLGKKGMMRQGLAGLMPR
ncbi:MAG: signal recognition particle protein [Rhodospirillaceae bacterium]|jgi:signal recognition particle subunit SRP54|nr:signal recognition particle protein [Rhodospirillaceae bacterium]MBT5455159.1 signal recognition particle protein [Rhodospirillaceae bacterium]